MKNFSKVEPLSKQFTVQWLREACSKTSRAVKIVIMDQKILAGVGNIYANDALFLAGVDPIKSANKVGEQALVRLHNSINKVIDKGISCGGASDTTYKHLDGLGGRYQQYFLTYKQNGKPCSRCGTLIKKIQLGGRGTYFCPDCQQ